MSVGLFTPTSWRAVDIHDYVRVFRRQIVLILAATLIGVASGALIAMLTPQRFEASAQMMVTVQVEDAATPSERSQATAYAQQVVETYRTLITSTLVLAPVVQELDLPRSSGPLTPRVNAASAPKSIC